jgi:hypothetical protein
MINYHVLLEFALTPINQKQGKKTLPNVFKAL